MGIRLTNVVGLILVIFPLICCRAVVCDIESAVCLEVTVSDEMSAVVRDFGYHSFGMLMMTYPSCSSGRPAFSPTMSRWVISWKAVRPATSRSFGVDPALHHDC